MPNFEPDAILAVLVQHGVEFIVIGGFAGSVQGSPLMTTDVDVVPLNDQRNLTHLSAALRELEAKVRNDGEEPLPFAHDATGLAGSVFWNLTTKHGDLDITFMPSGTTGYPDLIREAFTIVLEANTVQIASLGDIIRSKEAAGRDKDRRALPILRELLAEQLRNKR